MGFAPAMLVMGFFIVELLAYTWCRVQYTRVGYEISRAMKEQEHLTVVQKKLHVELAHLKSPERLAATVADLDMNLKKPSTRQMVMVE
jgi:hypothetical protein